MIPSDLAELRASLIKTTANALKTDTSAESKFKESGSELVIRKYAYQFDWLGRPIIQLPQDIIAFQEIVYKVKPDLIVETGIAHGGSIIYSASLLCLLDVMEGLDPRTSPRKVVGIDIDIREHNRINLDNHPLRFKMELIEGSSISNDVFSQVNSISKDYQKVVVALDSNHSHDHVLEELEKYSSLVSIDSYCIVFDTIIENLPNGSYDDRPWDVGNNAMTAVNEWLKSNTNFAIDSEIENKVILTVAPNGYLRRIK